MYDDAENYLKFVWNRYLLKPLLGNRRWRHWVLPLTHGYFR